MKRKDISRRQFVKGLAGTTAGIATFGASSSLLAKNYSNIIGANERVRIGVIGCGGMANAHMEALLKMKEADNIEIGAVCDVYSTRMNKASDLTKAKTITDYRKILDSKEFDSVLIASPEHWHYQMTLDAIEAGKHIYCEKPMTHTIEQAKIIIEKVAKSNIKMQVGVQGMSDDSYETANKMIGEGALGKVVMAHIDYSRNYVSDFWTNTIDPDAKPGINLDWEAWLGPAPKRPWDPRRFFEWRRYWDYSGGIATDLFIHRVTRIIKSLGLTFPDYVVASGGTWNFVDSIAEIPDTFNMMLDYPEKTTVLVASSLANDMPIRHVIRGHKATLEFTRTGFTITPQEATNEAIISGTGEKVTGTGVYTHKKTGAEDVSLHHRNLLGAIRENEPLKCDAMLGMYGVVACTMGVQSFRNRKYLKWDARNRKVVES
ncbi:MAG: Gfo/Idh/MocA family oxidoreductase [Bacteroidetes bacterium]|nr:Gfo/Idh/MocA family oxidoreductase [Bacteroidota bacterium]MDA1119523.1 Gfo/Idh/MocA family oxidoreductase [Bacteroidota bacterium]